MPPRRRSLLVTAQIAGALALIYFIGRDLASQWSEFQAQRLDLQLRLPALLGSALLVLGTYALLIQVWRVLLAGSGERIAFWTSARIWSVSNLWRYVPGKIWQIGAMTAMAQRAQVSAVAAAGTAVLNTVLNIATGLGLVLLLVWPLLDRLHGSARALAVGLLALAGLGMLLLPRILPPLARFAARVLGREVRVAAPRPLAIAMATAGNIISWALYGIAFMLLVHGVLGAAGGATWQYIAVFTASYVIGYLFLPIPGGVGPREAVMLWLLLAFNLMAEKQALLVTVASRLWLTLLELLPGLLFLAFNRKRPSPSPIGHPT